MEFSDGEISVLHEVLLDEIDRINHEPGRWPDEDDEALVDVLFGRVCDEAKARKLWWAR